jgi:hypothetical protein
MFDLHYNPGGERYQEPRLDIMEDIYVEEEMPSNIYDILHERESFYVCDESESDWFHDNYFDNLVDYADEY